MGERPKASRKTPTIADAGLLNEKTIGIDATTLEANAALRSIVRLDTMPSMTAAIAMYHSLGFDESLPIVSIPCPALSFLG